MSNVRIVAALALACALILGSTTSALAVDGKPIAPGNAPAGAFLSANSCACHQGRVQEWAQSMHSKALTDPIYQLKVKQAGAAAGDAVSVFCHRCHSPIGNLLNDPNGTKNPIVQEGVTCMFCHQVVGDTGTEANTSQLIQPDGTRRAQIMDPHAPHPAAGSTFLPTSEFCGGCHNVSHPINGAHLETSYQEWKDSPYSTEKVQCQECHMSKDPDVPGSATGMAGAGGPTRDHLYRMSFVGANVAQGNAEASVALLKSAASVQVNVPEVLAPGKETSLTVIVTNKGAGHYLPTGLTEVRQMWLTVSAVDANGTKTQLGETKYGTVLKDAKGKFPAEVWDAVAYQSDYRIPPKQSRTETFTFTMPATAKQAKIVAELNYKSEPDALAQAANVANPTTLMASSSTDVFANAQIKAAADTAAAASTGSGSASIEGSGADDNLVALLGSLVTFLVVGVGAGVAFATKK